MTCPNCNGKRHIENKIFGVYTCKRCGALHGQCYLGDSYTLVAPFLEDGELDGAVYFDLLCLGSKGITRRHGWFNPNTKKMVQVG